MILKPFAAFAGLVVASLPCAALSVEPQEFADALSGLFAQGNFEVSFDSVTLEGDDIVIDGVTAALAGEEPKDFDLMMVFKNAGETADGGFTADRATIDRFVFEEDEFSIRLDGLIWENVLFYENQPTDGLSYVFHQSRLFTGPLRVLVDGEEVLRVAYMESGNQVDEAAETVTYGYSAQGIRIDLTKLEDDELSHMAEEFGLAVIEMEMSGQALWDIAEGRFEVTDSFIDIGNIGKLAVGLDLLGYDEAFLAELYAMQQPDSAPADFSDEAEFAQVMHMAEGLFLNGARLRFDDDGITNKLLDFAAEEQGMPRAAMTIGFAAALPVLASELGVPESLQSALLIAASDYMISPRSFEVVLEPNKPVRLSRLAEAIEDEDAEALIRMFNFVVTANQD